MDPPDDHAREPSALTLGAAYLTNFGALAVYGPFLAVYLAYRGFDAEATAQLLALMVMIRLVATPAWTLLADKLQSGGLVLRIVGVGAAVTFALALTFESRVELALVLVVFAAFRAPFGPLIDALVLRWVAREGRSFGALRAWGTAGYSLAAFGTGALVAHYGARAIPWATTAALVIAALVAFALPRGGKVASRPNLVRPLVLLVRRPRFVLLLVTAALHQIGLSPYDSLFPAYLTTLAGAYFAAAAVALGAAAEVVFMVFSGALVRRFGPVRLLVIAYAASTVRWAAMAVVTHPWLLIALQSLHALGFGAFYVAGVAMVDQECPIEVRASAQGLFSAWAFGVAAALALSLSGVVAQHAGLRGVFAMASVTSAMATLIAIAMVRRSTVNSAESWGALHGPPLHGPQGAQARKPEG